VELRIGRTWDGVPVRADEEVRLRLSPEPDGLVIEVTAPFHGDPPPPTAAGSTDRLWEYEVVELFLLGAADRYTEIELGPHGHFLVLALAGRRNPVASGLPLDWSASIDGSTWSGRARIAWAQLPVPTERLNAFAIHGTGEARRYLAWSPVPGDRPDFHRIHLFPRLPDPLGGSPGAPR
jgi:hypothetical protein